MSIQSVGDRVLISFFIDTMSAALLYFDPKWKEQLSVMSAHPKGWTVLSTRYFQRGGGPRTPAIDLARSQIG